MSCAVLFMPGTYVKNTASFAARAVALAIDFALLAAFHLLLLFLLAGRIFHNLLYIPPLAVFSAFLLYVSIYCLSLVFMHSIYFTVFHAWSGQTIGKMIMGIRVVSRDDERISPAIAFLRWTGSVLSFVPLGTGFLWSAVDKDHRTWHDRLAQTWVVSAEMT